MGRLRLKSARMLARIRNICSGNVVKKDLAKTTFRSCCYCNRMENCYTWLLPLKWVSKRALKIT